MTAAVRALIPYSFTTVRLHRLEAACIPDNIASVRILEKTGFRREGYARGYLCIDAIWQDHLPYARLWDDCGCPHFRPTHSRKSGEQKCPNREMDQSYSRRPGFQR